jgi:hypothetical protein
LESPTAELEKRLTDGAKGVDTVKEFLVKVQAYVPADFYAALVDAIQEVESTSGSPVLLDGASPAFQQFADKLKVRSRIRGLPVLPCP